MDKELNTKITQQDPPRVVTFGEILLRLSAPGYERLLQSPRLEATFGGGEANVAVSLANFGLQSAFITKLPHNALGQAAVNSLRALGVETGGIVRGGARMGLYFLEKGASQRASVCLYDRAGSAMSQAQPKEFDWPQLLQGASWFHFTGITPALGAPVAEACRAACQAAKAQGVRVSCDLNYRQKLWSRAQANRVLGELCQLADVCICNEADARDVFGIAAPGSNLTRGGLGPPAVCYRRPGADRLLRLFPGGHHAAPLPEAPPAKMTGAACSTPAARAISAERTACSWWTGSAAVTRLPPGSSMPCSEATTPQQPSNLPPQPPPSSRDVPERSQPRQRPQKSNACPKATPPAASNAKRCPKTKAQPPQQQARKHHITPHAPKNKSAQVTTAVRKQQRSGKRSAHRPTRYGRTHKSAWYPVQCAATIPDAAQASPWQRKRVRKGRSQEPLSRSIKKAFAQQMLGAGRLRTARPRLWQRLSSPILSSLLKKESGPRRAVAYLPGRHWLVKICKFRFAPRVAEYCSADLLLCCSNPSDQAPHQVSHRLFGALHAFLHAKSPKRSPYVGARLGQRFWLLPACYQAAGLRLQDLRSRRQRPSPGRCRSHISHRCHGRPAGKAQR